MAVQVQPPQFASRTERDLGALTPVVCLVDVDPELTAGVPPEELGLLRRVLTRPRYDIPKGRWSPELLRGHDNGVFAILVIEGALVREVDLTDRHCAQMLGPGDVLQPSSDGGPLGSAVSWTAAHPTSVVALDDRFTRAAQRWPSLALNLHRRLLDQTDRTALHAATAQLPRVDRRILALFWQLADRWGRVTPFGIEIPLQLTHETIGRLVGAQRPTVTLALRDLTAERGLTRTSTGRWILNPRTGDALRPAADGGAAG